MTSGQLYRLGCALEKDGNPLGKTLKEYSNHWTAQVYDLKSKVKRGANNERRKVPLL